MKLYLTKDIKKLGQKGDLVNISDGYGRNYLLKRKLASTTPVSVVKRTNKENLSAKDIERLQTLKAAVEVKVKTSASGSLYAAVSPAEIQQALKAQYNVSVPQAMITLSGPIKKTGEHQVTIKDNAGDVHTIDVHINPLEQQ